MPKTPNRRRKTKSVKKTKRPASKKAPNFFMKTDKGWEHITDLKAALTPPPPPIRAQLLNDARDLTLGDRNKSYGDPLTNFNAIAALKKAFWTAMEISAKETDTHIDRMKTAQNTPWGHAIDMVFNNLGRIASAPTLEAAFAEDRYKDGINYLAIAYEIAKRQGG
ncbi:MAG: hypothetical protein KGL39_51285 [Patescibacteria group bacterium]|nr:hypothetical protein [Patescibacteria group bacterium]